MSNPDPEHITDEMWRLWTDRPNTAWKLGGIYANKKGYHNSVNANLRNWPNSYSIKLPLDLVASNRDKARAIDTTKSDSEMILWTKRMKASAENPLDNRLAAVKEFYGTLDGKTVFGLSKDSQNGPWRRSSADLTHLWHGHTSIFTAFVANWTMLAPIHSVWRGDTFTDWSLYQMQLPQKGDEGQSVLYWQYVHNNVRNTVFPVSPVIKIDGIYGPQMAAAVADFWKKSGGAGAFNGNFITGWLGMQYQKALAKTVMPTPIVVPEPTPISDEKLKELVNTWLKDNIPQNLIITGDVDGRITLA